MANPEWGVKMSQQFWLFLCHIKTCTPPQKNAQTPHPLTQHSIQSEMSALLLSYFLFSSTFKGIKRYASNQTKYTPMFDFLCHSLDQARARCN